MASQVAYSCDVCGTQKQESNHWFIATRLPGPRFVIITWDQSLRDPAAEPMHLCGMQCACQAMTKAMRDA